MDGSVVGREAELSAVDGFLESVEGGFAVLALEGEPGIGKTSIWQEAVRRAGARGYQTLTCRPGSSETRLSFAGLGDLLAFASDELLVALPAPQRRALEIALLRSSPVGPPPDQRTIAVAFLSLVRLLAAAGPLLIAVDDTQWLDLPSARVLEFAVRRLERDSVGILTSVRTPVDATQPFGDGAGEHRRSLHIGPLSVAALHELIKARVGRTFARPTLLKIAGSANGNPFYALEIARGLLVAGEPRAGEPLPVPDDLRKLVRARVRRLPADCRKALLVASALSAPTLELVDGGALAAAEDADIVRVTADDRVDFTHPLFASAVYGSATGTARRELHRQLAELVDNEEERARHLALGTALADEDVARALVGAARSAYERGAPASAAELAELALGRTPRAEAEARRVRKLELARYVMEAGDPPLAGDMLRELVAEAPAGPLRARAQLRLAFITEWTDGAEAATEVCEQALPDASGHAALEAELHAVACRICDFDTERKLSHATAALELLESASPSPQVEVFVLRAGVEAAFNAGRGIDHDLLQRAVALELAALPKTGILDSQRDLGNLHLITDEYETARAEYEGERRDSVERGDEMRLARIVNRMTILELRAGNWSAAEELLTELAPIVERTGQDVVRHWSLTLSGLLLVLRGRIEDARIAATEAFELAAKLGSQWNVAQSQALLGFLELSVGDLQAARPHLEAADEIYVQTRLGEPRLFRHQGDHIEALVGLGELGRARTALERLEAQSTGKPWAVATAAVCRGLLQAAEGDLERAERSFRRGLDEHERLGIPFELARTLLCFGRLQRRRKQQKAARETLQRSLDIFEQLGAPLWADKARAEVDRTHVRQAPSGLTPTERQVARLAATGLTNRQIAERLFVSPKTIEANLARAYRKLGIRSRAELGAAMAAPARSFNP